MIEYCVGFMFDLNRTCVVAVEKKRPAWQAGHYNGVGGHVEPGEQPHEAMAREFEEETGVRYEFWHKFVELHGEGYRLHVFAAFTPAVSAVETRTDESILICKVDWLLQHPRVLPNLRWLIPLALYGQDHLREDVQLFYPIIVSEISA